MVYLTSHPKVKMGASFEVQVKIITQEKKKPVLIVWDHTTLMESKRRHFNIKHSPIL